jgi:alpha-1,3-rhamnosyl/mannosyltransferase
VRVLVNQLTTGARKTGIGHYASELVRCLCALPGGHAVTDYQLPLLRRLWGRVGGSPTSLGGARPAARLRSYLLGRLRPLGYGLLRQYARLAFTRRHYDLYHEPNFIPLPSDLPTVATIHDLSAVLHPEWHPPERVRRFEKHFRAGLRRCEHFFAISEWARQEIVHTLGIPPQRVTRTYMGVRPGLGPLPAGAVREALARLGLPGSYLLHLGTVEPRKNVLTLLRAYCALPAALRSRHPLVLAGGWGWKAGDVAAYYQGTARHRGVLHLGYVADADLAALYGGARALAAPSLYEGFGLPPVEMLACGGAVLASAIGPHKETCGGRAWLVEPGDEGGWHDALRRVLADDAWWHHLRRGAAGAARPFTWDACARDTLDAYHAVLGRPRAREAA